MKNVKLFVCVVLGSAPLVSGCQVVGAKEGPKDRLTEEYVRSRLYDIADWLSLEIQHVVDDA